MDMQGTPIGSTNQGMKARTEPGSFLLLSLLPHLQLARSLPAVPLVPLLLLILLTTSKQNTTDPRAQDPNSESSGPVAADSLAAESFQSGGAYASNPNATPSGVEGSKSTLANTDTSAATTLDPTPDAAEREAKSAWSETADLRGSAGGLKYAEGVGGQPDFPGALNASGYSGAPSGTGSGSGAGSGVASYAGSSARTGASGGSSGYGRSGSGGESGGGSEDITSGTQSSGTSGGINPGEGKPKGKNLTEGGFEGEAANAGYVEIGSDEDPGRLAVQGFQNQNAAARGGAGPTQRELQTESGYDELRSEEQA